MRYSHSLLFIAAIMGINCARAQIAAVDLRDFVNEQTTTLKTPTGDIYGSLLMPTGDSSQTVVLLISDAGTTDRDGNQNLMRSNTLKMMAYWLAENNISSLRYDKRGVGASSEAIEPPTGSNTQFDSYVNDIKAWITHLRRDGRFEKIITLGHGEGASLAMTAINQGAKTHAFISLAGNGRNMDQLLKDQLENQPPPVRDIAYSIIDSLKMGHQVHNIPFFLAPMFRSELQPFVRSIMSFNPQNAIRGVTCPILIVQGDTDVQTKIEDARLLHAANPNSQLVIIPGMNHVLKDCPTTSRAHQENTLFNPALPLNNTLARTIVTFINNL